MLPFPLVYHDGYDLKFGAHVFPSQKYRLIRACLIDEYIAGPEDFLTPEQATVEQLQLVHTPDWVAKLQSGKLTYHEILKLEVPYSRKMVEAFFLAAGGTLLAARQALIHGIGFNIGGGFHHAFAGHGEGFCAINDMAVAVRVLQQEHLIKTALVIDCDVHHGNGTASVFAHDPSVFTISIHHFNNYPTEKPPSTVDIHLGDGVGDQEYLEKLRSAYDTAVCGFRPDLVVYVAGSDPYYDDKLGGLSLTREGLYLRDRVVFDAALRQHVPVAVTLAGGYARKLEDTVTLHMRTVKAALASYQEFGWKSDAD
ncbi:histone deacetylase family protein [Paludibaculum fermentans]|uniref:Histone deacetylase n=1 Tax=Paludibaculum fermentans TaxID=1473598 RepID=A0A7S7SHV5_PALFE|nr:histone deacetylase [Paludibaculum fermentans]QOY85043.1 histone deacetylase [Paludibaculum fermentans]